ncbi:MAG: NIL domain-containing protein [Desulfobaccales bacterium]|jgi:Fe-S-cluster-containing dehydrogenase component
MSDEKVVLNFPPQIIDQPIIYRLIKERGLVVNILQARISPNEWGRMVVEIGGNEAQLDAATKFLKELGVRVESLAGEVRWLEDRCNQCTACISACPTHALVINRAGMTVTFDKEKCIACELCLSTCPYQALEILFE